MSQINVYDDCDDVSPGEWSPVSRGGSSVSSFDRLHPQGFDLSIHGVRENETLVPEIHAMDRDAAPLGDFVVSTFSEVQGICNGQEEPQELSGSHDLPGRITLVLNPEKRRRGGSLGGWSDRGECGDRAYQANVGASSSAQF